jgi:hypothetical protein
VKRGRPFLADWRSVRVWESDTRHHLRQRHSLWLHGWCIGLIVVLAMWGASHLQMLLGVHSLAVRYLVTLGVGYGAFLAVLRVWAGTLVGEDPVGEVDVGEAAFDAADLALDVGLDVADGVLSAAPDIASGLGDVAGGALEAVGSADEGAVVVVPVVVVFAIVMAVVFGAGAILVLFFGVDVLLAGAVEIAFGYVSARTAVRVAREGWLSAAVRLTWKPLLASLALAVLLGGLIDHFIPQAQSLPHALRLIIK